jgi:ParB-like chromosome segregation protein Spo0J
MSREEEPTAALLPHPLADVVTAMSDDEFRELRLSIRAHGLLPGEEIVVHDGRILDGRERYKACLAEGVEPRFREYAGNDPADYVLAKITRRNLDEGRKALLVAGLLQREAGRDRPRWTETELGRTFGVGRTIVAEAGRVLRHAVPKLKRMVENGEVTVKYAEKVCRLPAKEQQRVVDVGAYSVIVKARQIIHGKIRVPVPPEQPPASVRPPAEPPGLVVPESL